MLLAAYVCLSFFMNPNGYLGTDTGGKVATLEEMSSAGTFDPDLGYWAEQWDPDGDFHPLFYTFPVGDRWVNVTSMPMPLVGRILYDLGGYRAALLLPMIGSVLAAFGARAVARRLDGDEWMAYWVVGLASPVTIYALDFWEHSLGLALLVWATVLLLDALYEEAVWWRGALAGLAFGAAAALRTEALVYAVVAIGVTCLVVWRKRHLLAGAIAFGAAASVTFLAALLANSLLERAVLGGAVRSVRASGAASSAGGELSQRAGEAMLTSVGLVPSLDAETYVVGAGLLVLMVFSVRAGLRPASRRVARIAAVGIVALYALRGLEGPGFVPGLTAAWPFAAVGLALGWTDSRRKAVLAFALLPLPLVWMFQFTGGAGPQWAGRYVLLTGVLLATVGVVGSGILEAWQRRFFVGLSVAVTLFGLLWLGQRSHDVAESGQAFADRPEPVLITTIAHQAREYGAFYDDRLWLTAAFTEDRERVVEVVEAAGYDEFGYVAFPGDPPEIEGWKEVGTETVPFLGGVDVQVTTFRRSD